MPLLRDPGALVRRALAAPAAAQAHCIRMSLGKFQAESTMLWTISTLCVLLTLLALSFYDWPYNRDITTYATLAQELVYDKRLYVDVWDFKPPAIFATYMIAQYMIESKPIQIFLLHLCASIVIMVILIRSGREAGFGDAAGLLSGLLWLVLSNDLALQMHEPNTEIFINLCVVTAFFLFLSLHGRSLFLIPILIGTLFAIACLFKTVAIVMAVMALTYLILPPPDCNRSIALAQVAVMAASAALCLAAVFGYFALTGRFPVFWEVLVHAGADYAATAWQGVLNRLGRSSIGGARLWLGAAVAVFPWCLVALLAWLDRDRRRPWVLLGTYAFAALTAVILPGQFYAHYFQLLVPPLCLGLGWLTALLAQKGRGILAAAGPAIAGLCLVGLVAYEAPSCWLPPEVILRGTYQELYLAWKIHEALAGADQAVVIV